MWWQLALGRFLQACACAGALLTVLDWIRFGGAHVRVGRILLWSAIVGLVAAAVATRSPRRRGGAR
ncbi:hypothetical protein TBR22_A33370 [Luteitalea sp. TBR-22]|uniref:hypothetical protein n=1 Tax=Luteitalea sp. TBR-22 TaxID=2802971 RepID=UPI001AF54906|nr:hypothetical protein [Luteitalea sp. TBR-22]BCS34108.1 hypothetical protein TBR22_A33370 [Luteitalea sp. TBR-22]